MTRRLKSDTHCLTFITVVYLVAAHSIPVRHRSHVLIEESEVKSLVARLTHNTLIQLLRLAGFMEDYSSFISG